MQPTKSLITLIFIGAFIVFAIPTAIDAFWEQKTGIIKILLAPTMIIFLTYISVGAAVKDFKIIEALSQPAVIILALFYLFYPLIPQEFFTKTYNLNAENKQIANSFYCAILCFVLTYLLIFATEILFKLWNIKINGKILLILIILGGLIYQAAPLFYSADDLIAGLKFCKNKPILSQIANHFEATHKLFPDQIKEKYGQIFLFFSGLYFSSGLTERLKEEKPVIVN